MKDLILITGASSGIGYEMAHKLAEKKFDLIITARNHEKLQQLAEYLSTTYGVAVHVFTADLSEAGAAAGLYKEIKNKRLNVTMLVNNAGFGAYGNFTDITLDEQLAMINVNITALVTLSHLFISDMKKSGRGKVMNIASLLSYLPFPYYSVYSATKCFVLAFTETLAEECKEYGIEVKALCPGPVDTAFNSSEMLNTNAYKANKPLPPAKVAEQGVKHLLTGKGSKKVGFNNWFISNLPRITPDFIMMKIKKTLASPKK